jgi:hypothetical protein
MAILQGEVCFLQRFLKKCYYLKKIFDEKFVIEDKDVQL